VYLYLVVETFTAISKATEDVDGNDTSVKTTSNNLFKISMYYIYLKI